MKARMALATLFAATAAVALAAAAGAAGERQGGEADARALVNALRNLSDVQEQALRTLLLTTVEKATREFLANLQQVLDDDEYADLAAVFDAASAPSKRSMGGTSISAEDIRRILQDGMPSRNIPPLDPFRVSYVPLNLVIPDVIDLQANIEDLSFNGLSSFRQDIGYKVSISIIPISLTVNISADVLIPRLQLLTFYKADASLDLGLDIFGEGLIELLLNRLRATVNIAINGNGFSSPTVSPCEIGIISRGIQLEIEGLFGGGLLSQLVGEIITDMVNDVLGDVFDLIANTIQGGVCGWLGSKSTLDLIGLLRKITSMPLPDTPT